MKTSIRLFLIAFIILMNLNNNFAQEKQFDWLRKQDLKTLNKKELEKGLDICSDIIDKYQYKNDKLVAEAYKIKGLIYCQLGSDFDDYALSNLLSAVTKSPKNDTLHNKIGIIYKRKNQFSDARIHFENAIQINNKNLQAYLQLIELNEKQGKIENNIDLYNKYLKIDKNNENIWFKLGICQLVQNKISESKYSLEQAININPHYTEARMKIIYIYKDLKNWNEAIIHLKKILDYERDNKEAQKLLREIEEQKKRQYEISQFLSKGETSLQKNKSKDWENSISYYKKVLEIDPSNSTARQGVEDALKKLCDYWYITAKSAKSRREWSRAYNYYTNSLVYAQNNNDKNRAFNELKLAAQNLGITLKAKTAEEAAKQALEHDEYEKAKEQLLAIKVLRPDLSNNFKEDLTKAELGSYYQMGISQMNNDNHELALAYLKIVFLIDNNFKEINSIYLDLSKQNNINILQKKIKNAFAGKRVSEAKLYLKELLKLDPNNKEFQSEFKKIRQSESIIKIIIVSSVITTLILLFFIYLNLTRQIKSMETNKDISLIKLQYSAERRFAYAIFISMLYFIFVFYCAIFFGDGNNIFTKMANAGEFFALGVPIFAALSWIFLGTKRLKLIKDRLSFDDN